MRILTRYILWELSAVFLVTLTTMTLFVFLALIGKEAVENGLGLTPILRMLPYMLPQAMQFAVPGAMLLAATNIYGRVAASNEVVAVKSLGISPMTLVWPALALACAASFASTVLNDVAVSWGRSGVDRVILESLEDIAYGKLRTVRSFSNDRLKVNVKRVAGHRLIDPTIQFSASGDQPPSLITAAEAELTADPVKNAVTIRLVNMDGDLGGWTVIHPGEFRQTFPLDDFLGRKQRTRTPSNFSLAEIRPARVEQVEVIRRTKANMAAVASTAMLLGNIEDLSRESWQRRQGELRSATEKFHRLETEPYRRWANGFSCLGFVLVGAPMAIRRRHGEFWGSFFACFLPILLAYYPMLVGVVDKAKDGVLPPPTVWLGNIMLALWGVWLMRRVIRF
jgi:lipopolysaccharide export system permease protein